MKEIILDHNTLKHRSVYGKKGKIKIKTTLSLEEYKKYLENTYQKLKFKRKFSKEHITQHPNAAIYLYHIDDKIVPRTAEEIKKEKRDMFLSNDSNNKTKFNITIEKDEIHFIKRYDLGWSESMKFGCALLEEFSSKSVSHINIKKLPFKLKDNLDIHPMLYKKTQKKELIEANIYSLFDRYSGLTYLTFGSTFKESTLLWDREDKSFLDFVKKGNQLLPEIKRIHGNHPDDILGNFTNFVKEILYRMSLDALNENLVMMEVYIKSFDSLLSKEKIKNFSKEDLKEFNNYYTKYKAVSEILPFFPITIFVQKRTVEIMKKSHPHLFDTGKESLSYFE